MNRSILIPLLLLAAVPGAWGQTWTRATGAEGGAVRSLAIHPHGLIAALQYDHVVMYRWDEQRWSDLGSLGIYRLDAVGGTVIASSENGLVRYNESNRGWAKIGPNNAITVAVNGDTIYAVDMQQVHRSSDAGQTWQPYVNLGPDVQAMAFHGTTVLVGIAKEPGFVRSSDAGKSWKIVSAGLPHNSNPVRIFNHAGTFYAAMFGISPSRTLGIYRSTDDGLSWEAVNDGLDPNGYPWVQEFYHDGASVAMATARGIYRLEAQGWVGILSNPVTDIARGAGDTLYAGTSGGVTASFDAGLTWKEISGGLTHLDIAAIHSEDSVLIASTYGGIYRSTNRGAIWTRALHHSTQKIVRAGDALIAHIGPFAGDGLQRSTDMGITWNPANDGIDDPERITALAAGTNTAFVGIHEIRRDDATGAIRWYAGGVYRSTDGGVSWTPVNNGLPRQDDTPVPIVLMSVREDVIIAATVGGLYRSTNSGENWDQVGAELGTTNITAISVHDGAFFLSAGGAVYRSTNDGSAWETVGNETFPAAIGAFHSVGRALIAGELNNTESRRIYLLNGDRWSLINERFPDHLIITSIVVASDLVVIGTYGQGIWRGALDGVSDVDSPTGSPVSVGIHPHPVTTRSILNFTLSSEGSVRLTIHDGLGNQLFNRDLGRLEAGTHTTDIDLDGLPSGAYAYRISVDGADRNGIIIKAE